MHLLPFQQKSPIRLGLVLSTALLLSPGILNCADPGAGILLEAGSWGGRGAALTAMDKGAVIEFDCAKAYIREPITLQPDGRFSISGEFVPDTGGPARLSEPEPQGLPAIISGEISDSRLLLLVDMPGEDRTIGPFILTRSQTAILRKCL